MLLLIASYNSTEDLPVVSTGVITDVLPQCFTVLLHKAPLYLNHVQLKQATSLLSTHQNIQSGKNSVIRKDKFLHNITWQYIPLLIIIMTIDLWSGDYNPYESRIFSAETFHGFVQTISKVHGAALHRLNCKQMKYKVNPLVISHYPKS